MNFLLPLVLLASLPVNDRGTTFGKGAAFYAAGRKGYPNEVFEVLAASSGIEGNVLELGCGTGIATRQLFDAGFSSIIATDIDPLMLEEAKKLCSEARFQCEDVHALSFSDQIFDTIVAFGCFHWFCDAKAIAEIQRVLKPDGNLFIVNKKVIGAFRQELRDLLSDLEQMPVPEPKQKYRPIETLSSHGFTVQANRFQAQDLYSGPQLLAYCQSLSIWTSLSPEKQKQYLPFLEEFVMSKLQDGHCSLPVEIQCLSGAI